MGVGGSEMGAVTLSRPCAVVQRSTVVAEMHPANKSTPLDAGFLACQVASVGISRCAAAKGHALRYQTVWASRNDDARAPKAEIHPRNAPGQRKHQG